MGGGNMPVVAGRLVWNVISQEISFNSKFENLKEDRKRKMLSKHHFYCAESIQTTQKPAFLPVWNYIVISKSPYQILPKYSQNF